MYKADFLWQLCALEFYGTTTMSGNLQALERPLWVTMVVPSLGPVVHVPLKRSPRRGQLGWPCLPMVSDLSCKMFLKAPWRGHFIALQDGQLFEGLKQLEGSGI